VHRLRIPIDMHRGLLTGGKLQYSYSLSNIQRTHDSEVRIVRPIILTSSFERHAHLSLPIL
jgi:hypothetical protein